MKINIKYNFREGPWGGANQFLKALRKELKKVGVYSDNPNQADVILFNSHHEIDNILKLKRKFPKKVFVHRVDGPVYKIRGNHMRTDKLIFKVNDLVADGTIYQTNWCKKNNIDLGMERNNFETIINNAPDQLLFNRKNKSIFNYDKPKIIATSWSDSWGKGFDVYRYLDNNLNFDRFSMTFVGNSPINFKNIKKIDPLPSEKVAKKLKEHDIYITASRNDPCSNSLIEALSCGLPAVVLNDGGHPELVGAGGICFKNKRDIIKRINKIADNYFQYKDNIPDYSIQNIASEYIEFIRKIIDSRKNKDYQPKQTSAYSNLSIKGRIIYNFIYSVPNRIKNYVNKRKQ